MILLEYNCSFRENFVKRLGQLMDVSAIEVKIYYYYYYYYYYYLTNISNTKDRVWVHFHTKKRQNVEGFGNVIEDCLECLIYPLNQNKNQGENREIKLQKSLLIKIRYPDTLVDMISFVYTSWIIK